MCRDGQFGGLIQQVHSVSELLFVLSVTVDNPISYFTTIQHSKHLRIKDTKSLTFSSGGKVVIKYFQEK